MKEFYNQFKKSHWGSGYHIGLVELWGLRIPFSSSELEYLETLDDEEYEKVKAWCSEELLPYMTSETVNYRHNSFGLKHIAQKRIGFYVSNATIKAALAELGVHCCAFGGGSDPNVCYGISESFYS